MSETFRPQPPPPANSVEKMRAAKADADRVRARLYAALAAGDLTFHDVLDLAERNHYVAQTRLRRVLVALPRWNEVRAVNVMARLGITPKRTVGGLLTKRGQKDALLAVIYPTTKKVWVSRPWDGWPYRNAGNHG